MTDDKKDDATAASVVPSIKESTSGDLSMSEKGNRKLTEQTAKNQKRKGKDNKKNWGNKILISALGSLAALAAPLFIVIQICDNWRDENRTFATAENNLRKENTTKLLSVWRDRNSGFSLAWERISKSDEKMKADFIGSEFRELKNRKAPKGDYKKAYEKHVVKWVNGNNLESDIQYLMSYFQSIEVCIETKGCDKDLAVNGQDSLTSSASYFFQDFRPYIFYYMKDTGNTEIAISIKNYGLRGKSSAGKEKETTKTESKSSTGHLYCKFF